jgi:hypothetical protein
MQRTPPRHLAPTERTRSQTRDHLLVESLLALVAIVLTGIIVFGPLLPEASVAARLPNLLPPAPTTTRTEPSGTASRPAPVPAKGNLLVDPSVEAGTAGVQALGGTSLERVGDARQGSWAVRLAGGSERLAGIALVDVTRLKPRSMYVATAWVRASQPAATVQVHLVETRSGERFAVDTAGAVVGDDEWRRLEVAHIAKRPGAALSLEIVSPDLENGLSVLVDDLSIQAKPGSFLAGP